MRSIQRGSRVPWASALVLALALVLGGCGGAASGKGGGRIASQPVSGGTLVWGRGSDAVGLDPAHETDGESYKVCDNIYENLVAYDSASTQVVPELATSWEISPDGKSYTFHLRQGVRFHDGSAFNAAAVVFSLDRQHTKTHPFHAVGGPYTYWDSMSMSDIIDHILAADDSTVVFHLKRPNAPFLANLAMNFAMIVSPTAVAKDRDDYFKHPVGTGPFRFVEWVKDDRIVLERNPEYWGQKPYLDRVVFKSIPENTVRLLALTKGDVQGMDGISPLEARRIQNSAGLELYRIPGMNVAYLAMRMDMKPFDKLEVRQAMNYAIDKKSLVEGLYMGFGTPAVNPIPPSMWSYDKAIADYGYDPAKAKSLLAQAGVAPGTKFTLYAMSASRPYMPEPLKVAEAIQANLRAVGLDADIRTMEWGAYLDYIQHLKHQVCIIGWQGDNGDPDNFFYPLLDKEAARIPAQNYSNYQSDALHQVLVQAQSSSDPATRTQLYEKAQEIVHADLPWVPLAHMDLLNATRKTVHGFVPHPTSKLRLKGVWVEPST
ncbi:MAG TPA: ABC transporter substrate-binding protein [Candidatus Eisenbacteria bacterium]|jgi:peptide/nickel transport system substrate-binding protein|nr:ABC transporter substrate-binding protein [Candidatus Eisenbacteria bacterium]